MPQGGRLTEHQIDEAINFNRARHSRWIFLLREALKLPILPIAIDKEFVLRVADWQDSEFKGRQPVTGMIDHTSEAHLNILHPQAQLAAERAQKVQQEGKILFDSWGNDARLNGGSKADGQQENKYRDGAHLNRVYDSFSVKKGSYPNMGFDGNHTVTVAKDATFKGPFRYRVCADIISGAYHDAGAMAPTRSTSLILKGIREKGYVWHLSESFPTQTLPGDFICTKTNHGSHSGIVTKQNPIGTPPIVVELPGPSTYIQILGKYDPTQTNDIREGVWSKHQLPMEDQYLGRLLPSKFWPTS